MMPVMDGHELIRTIRACRHQRLIKQLPILVVTGNEESNARELALKPGATAFIPKPFSADDLTGALACSSRRRDSRCPTDHPRSRLPARFRLLSNVPEPEYYYLRIEQAFSFHMRQNLDLALMHVKLNNYRH
jgi:two-component system, cell cycle response regulator